MERVVVDGVSLAYELRPAASGSVPAGEAARRPVVALLNGIAMSIAHWKPVADRLVSAGFPVLLHDFRGQLLSDKPEGPYSLERHAADLASLLTALGIETAAVVGTSYGAEIGLTFARDFPARCASLSLIDGVSETDAVLSAAVDSWKRAALADPRLFYRVILPWNYSAEWLEANAELIAKREAAIAGLPRDYFDGFVRMCGAFLAVDLTKDLPRIAAPTLVVVAEKDILKHRRFARVMADGIPGARFAEIPGSGHAVVIERPEATADLVLEFLLSQ